jgi:hypothetical protein
MPLSGAVTLARQAAKASLSPGGRGCFRSGRERRRPAAEPRYGSLMPAHCQASLSSAASIRSHLVRCPGVWSLGGQRVTRRVRRGRVPTRSLAAHSGRGDRGSKRPGYRPGVQRRAAGRIPPTTHRGRSSAQMQTNARAAIGRLLWAFDLPFGSSKTTASSRAHQAYAAWICTSGSESSIRRA